MMMVVIIVVIAAAAPPLPPGSFLDDPDDHGDSHQPGLAPSRSLLPEDLRSFARNGRSTFTCHLLPRDVDIAAATVRLCRRQAGALLMEHPRNLRMSATRGSPGLPVATCLCACPFGNWQPCSQSRAWRRALCFFVDSTRSEARA